MSTFVPNFTKFEISILLKSKIKTKEDPVTPKFQASMCTTK